MKNWNRYLVMIITNTLYVKYSIPTCTHQPNTQKKRLTWVPELLAFLNTFLLKLISHGRPHQLTLLLPIIRMNSPSFKKRNNSWRERECQRGPITLLNMLSEFRTILHRGCMHASHWSHVCYVTSDKRRERVVCSRACSYSIVWVCCCSTSFSNE